MAYLDDKILEKRERKKKEIYTTLESGMYLDGKIIHFKRRELFGAFSVMFPDSWKQMPIEYARIQAADHYDNGRPWGKYRIYRISRNSAA